MKIGILSNEQHTNQQKNSIGSSRIRCSWLLPYWAEAEEFRIGQPYDVVIYQKAYFLEHMRIFKGIKILDLCDPDWMEGKPVVEAAGLCDAVTVSSVGLREYLEKILDVPVIHVDDRVDLAQHTQRKVHEGRAAAAVWFGYHQNHSVLDGVLPTLKRLGLDLTVISDLPYYPKSAIAGLDAEWVNAHVKNVKFDPETINEEIVMGGEFVLNNRPDGGKFTFKSENKTVISWALGMPVAKDAEDVERYMEPEARAAEAEARLKQVAEKWDSKISVLEYQGVIEAARIKRERAHG